MSLADSINKLKEATASNNNSDGENAFSKLAHKQIKRSSKREPHLRFRILPPAKGKELFFTELRQWGVEYHKQDNSRIFTALNLKANVDENDPLDMFINQLRDTNSLPKGSFGEIYPKKHFYVNIVPYQSTSVNGVPQIQMQADENGLPDVYVMDLSKLQMESINEALANPLNNPNIIPANINAYNYTPTEEQKEWSFISDAFAYMIDLKREGGTGNTRVKYQVTVQSNFCLAPLPEGWETKLEDLDALAEPSYTSSPSWVNSVINQMKADRGMIGGQTSTQPQAPSRPANAQASAWNQAVGAQTQPQPQTTTSTTMPVYQQGDYVQQQPVYNQPTQQMPTQAPVQNPVQPAPIADPRGFQMPMNQAQVAPTPQQQTAPQAQTPQQAPVNPLSNFGAPLSETPQAQVQAPQQTPTSPVQPQAPTVATPDESATDVLANMGIDLDNL